MQCHRPGTRLRVRSILTLVATHRDVRRHVAPRSASDGVAVARGAGGEKSEGACRCRKEREPPPGKPNPAFGMVQIMVPLRRSGSVGNGLRAVSPGPERHGVRSLQNPTACYPRGPQIELCPNFGRLPGLDRTATANLALSSFLREACQVPVAVDRRPVRIGEVCLRRWAVGEEVRGDRLGQPRPVRAALGLGAATRRLEEPAASGSRLTGSVEPVDGGVGIDGFVNGVS